MSFPPDTYNFTMFKLRFLPVSLTSILVELATLEETLAVLNSLQTTPITGIKEIVPAARTLLISFAPEIVSAATIAGELNQREFSINPTRSGYLIEIPVHYDGPDLEHVAQITGLSVADVIRRHTESEFTVAFCGFAPGFAYLSGGDPSLYVPRRESPRAQIPAGSVALAGAFSGVYPQSSPGGWQIIGTTPLRTWDSNRTPGALLQPGNRVRFVALDGPSKISASPILSDSPGVSVDENQPHFKVTAASFPALFQDIGRHGQSSQGIAASGAIDRSAFHAANRLVGNPKNTPCLEITFGGFSFKSTARVVIGCAGAPCPITLQDAEGTTREVATQQPIALEPGDEVRIGHTRAGMRCYLAVRGGFEVNQTLGSAATDTLANLGPAPVVAGTILGLKDSRSCLQSVSLYEPLSFKLPAAGDIANLDVVLGPRTDWFTEKGIEIFTQQHWQVTAESSRVGVRLSGSSPIERRKEYGELASEGTMTGAIQVPHTGLPVLFLADRPLTGGYPVIGNVAEYHVDILGQLPINSRVRFCPITPFEEIYPISTISSSASG